MRKSLYILGRLHDTDIAWLARNGKKSPVPPGAVLIREGEHVNTLFIVLDGQLSVHTEGGGEVARLLAGDIVGEISFVDSRPPLASVVVARDAVILSIAGSVLQAKLDADSQFASRFYRALAIFLADRLRNTTARAQGRVEAAEDLDVQMLDNATLGAKHFDELIRTAVAG